MANIHWVSFRRLALFWEGVKDYIKDIVTPESTKEVFSVVTYSDVAPLTAEDGEYYINSDENALYVYDEDDEEEHWKEVTPNPDSVFITEDTNHMYVIGSGGVYTDVTGEQIDDTIYTNNLDTDLDVTDSGVYKVCYSFYGLSAKWFTLVVTSTYRTVHNPRPVRVYTYHQILQNNEGFSTRAKNDGVWSAWENNTYAYKKDIDDLKPLIYAGL